MPIIYNRTNVDRLEEALRQRRFNVVGVGFNQIRYIEEMLSNQDQISTDRRDFIQGGICFALSAYFLREVTSNPHFQAQLFINSLENPVIFNKLAQWQSYTVALLDFLKNQITQNKKSQWDREVHTNIESSFKQFKPPHEPRDVSVYPSTNRPSQLQRFKFLESFQDKHIVDTFTAQRESFFWNKVTKNYTGLQPTMENDVKRIRLHDYHQLFPGGNPQDIWKLFWMDAEEMIREYSNRNAKKFVCGHISTVDHTCAFVIFPSPMLAGQGQFMFFEPNNGLWTVKQRTRSGRMTELIYLILFFSPTERLEAPKPGEEPQLNFSLLALDPVPH